MKIAAYRLFASVLVACTLRGTIWAKESDAAPSGDAAKSVCLFDGKSLAGWEGNLDMFRIEDGAIVGGTLKKPVPRNEFLCSTRQYADFELRLKFKLIGDGVNGGVQIRSRRVPNHHEVSGYQADLADGYWGCLYDESRRNRILAGPAAADRGKPVKAGQWNDYVIRCEGRRIQLWINGRKTCDYTEVDASIPQKGVIGLQIHGGGPSEAWYKDIAIRELPGK
jgi:hypothetical protein